ncbi:MAG: PLP-dependent lyase/thiolase [bacterium]|nr:PLP-dependent lyase/thiolase [bacterium]
MLTPQTKTTKLATKLGLLVPLYLKREDLHPYGSHKGRSIPVMIDNYAKQGVKNFVVSSSGNAALAAALHIIQYNKTHRDHSLSLKIMVGLEIDLTKLEILKKLPCENLTIEQVKNPKQTAFQLDKDGLAKNLRQSNDNVALAGYAELAKELASASGGKLSAVFIPTSSGTTAEGLWLAFKKLKINPQIHIVQTTACHPIADAVNGPTKITGMSSAKAIVDKVALRKNKVAEAIKMSGGAAWIATDHEIKSAIDLVKDSENIDISSNSALSIAGLVRAIACGQKFTGAVVCLITGR